MQFKDLPIGTKFTLIDNSDTFMKVNNDKSCNTAVITYPDFTIDLDEEVSPNTSFTVFLFSPDGMDCVSDFKETQSIDECWENVSNMGSNRIFYPLSFVFGDETNTVADCDAQFNCIGMTVKEVKAYLQESDIQERVRMLLS